MQSAVDELQAQIDDANASDSSRNSAAATRADLQTLAHFDELIVTEPERHGLTHDALPAQHEDDALTAHVAPRIAIASSRRSMASFCAWRATAT